MADSLSHVHSQDLEEINCLQIDNCFLVELTDSIEIDLTSKAFQSPQYVFLRDRFQSKLDQLLDIVNADDLFTSGLSTLQQIYFKNKIRGN